MPRWYFLLGAYRLKPFPHESDRPDARIPCPLCPWDRTCSARSPMVSFVPILLQKSQKAQRLISRRKTNQGIPPPSTAFQHRFISQSLMRLVAL
jgi:hypothetical protein